jgi:hypothetical protein
MRDLIRQSSRSRLASPPGAAFSGAKTTDIHGHYSYNIDRFVCRKKKIGSREEVLQA